MPDQDRPVTASYTIEGARALIQAAEDGNPETNYSHASVSRSIQELKDAMVAAEAKVTS